MSRTVITCFLLFTYSLGFAHNLIPHCETSNVKHQVAAHHESSHHHHEHHEHSSEDEKGIDHEHILHNGHLDGDIYDFIVCFLSEMEHPTKDCNLEHFLLANSNDKVNTQLVKAKFVAVLFTVLCLVAQDEALPKSQSEFATVYLSPPIDDSPHRGPPSLSC